MILVAMIQIGGNDQRGWVRFEGDDDTFNLASGVMWTGIDKIAHRGPYGSKIFVKKTFSLPTGYFGPSNSQSGNSKRSRCGCICGLMSMRMMFILKGLQLAP